MRFEPSNRGFCKVTTIFSGSRFGTKTDKTALGGFLLKLSSPSVHARMKLWQGTCPASLAGRSVKKIVDGDISVSLPSLKETFDAVCTNITGGFSVDFSVAANASQPKDSATAAPAAQRYLVMFIEGPPYILSQEKLQLSGQIMQ